MKPKTLRQRAHSLSRQITIPPGELLHLIAAAGLTAVETTLAHRGKLTLPLRLETAGDIVPPLEARTVTPLPAVPGMGKASLIASAPAETLPVHLPAAVALRLLEMCELAGINGGLDAFVSSIMEGTLESTAADVLIELWGITDPETVARLEKLQSEAMAAAKAGNPGKTSQVSDDEMEPVLTGSTTSRKGGAP